MHNTSFNRRDRCTFIHHHPPNENSFLNKNGPFSKYLPRHKKIYGCICITSENRILVVKGKATGKWSFPKGHVEGNETNLSCALRELSEETGIQLTTDYSYYMKLSVGGYYIFFLANQPEPLPFDSGEIEVASWIEFDDIKSLSCNVDLNAFKHWIHKQKKEEVEHTNQNDIQVDGYKSKSYDILKYIKQNS